MLEEYAHGLYHVLVMSTPASLPISFALHTYLVTIAPNGSIDRFDVFHSKTLHGTARRVGYVYHNALPPEEGLRTLHGVPSPRFSTRVIGVCSGAAGSVACALHDVVGGSLDSYPYTDHYAFYPGPNSNTYVQWRINQVPDCTIQLPWNAFGKGFSPALQ